MSPALLLVAILGNTPHAVLLDFSATWCGPCQQMKPIVEQLEHEGYPVRQIDVDQQPELAQRYNVTAYPTFILVVDGEEVTRLLGKRPAGDLRRMFRLVPKGGKAESTERGRQENSGQGESRREMRETKERQPWLPEFLRHRASQEETSEQSETVARGQTPESPASSTPAAPIAAQDPMRTAVRIRVTNPRGVDYGSGTVIGSKEGQALILTCFHIFRGMTPKDKIEVDLFPDGPGGEPKTFPGQLIVSHEDADVALIGITGVPLMPVSPIAPGSSFPEPRDKVASIGCSKGKPRPTKEWHIVTRINPFQGPDTTECTGRPAIGRSGGGLFDARGDVIGVCFAAEEEQPRGVYVGLAEIHNILNEAGFGALVPEASETMLVDGEEQAAPADADVSVAEALVSAAASAGQALTKSVAGGDADSALASEQPVAGAVASQPLHPSRAAEIVSALEGGEYEATIILRRRDRPNMPSQIVVINQVSDRFRRYLTGEIAPKTTVTSMQVKKSRHPNDVAQLAAIFNNHKNGNNRDDATE